LGLARLDGRICLITGATSGIGLETAAGLAALGAHVVMVGRDRERGEQARKGVIEKTGNDRVDLLLADLSSVAGVRALAREFLATWPALHVLVNNAGTVELKRTTTVDGFEKTFAVNHLSYFLLTNLLLPRLRASAPARIVNVASEAHRFGRLDLADLQSERSYQAMRVYGTSKLLNILFTVALAEKLAGSGVTVNCLHPGAVRTRLGKNNGAWARVLIGLLGPFFLTPEQGAVNSIFVAASDQLDGVSGKYFVKQRAVPPSRRSQRPGLARRVWVRSSELVGGVE
jgi:NAD(P)-dependent dehydrogenase (short-subunit alcohol dehydrogenase family)